MPLDSEQKGSEAFASLTCWLSAKAVGFAVANVAVAHQFFDSSLSQGYSSWTATCMKRSLANPFDLDQTIGMLACY